MLLHLPISVQSCIDHQSIYTQSKYTIRIHSINIHSINIHSGQIQLTIQRPSNLDMRDRDSGSMCSRPLQALQPLLPQTVSTVRPEAPYSPRRPQALAAKSRISDHLQAPHSTCNPRCSCCVRAVATHLCCVANRMKALATGTCSSTVHNLQQHCSLPGA